MSDELFQPTAPIGPDNNPDNLSGLVPIAPEIAKAEAKKPRVRLDTRWGLRQKQLIFAERIVVHGQHYRAAIEAGYSPASARTSAYANMRCPKVKQAIADMTAEMCARANLDHDYVINSLLAEAEYFGEGSTQAARVSALKVLADVLGMSNKLVQHDVAITIMPTLEDLIVARQKMKQFRLEIGAPNAADEPDA